MVSITHWSPLRIVAAALAFAATKGDVPHRLVVLTSGDLVRGWRRPGLAVDFTWQKFGDVQAVTRIEEQIGSSNEKSTQRWRAAVTIGFTTVKGQLLPSSFKLERIFGKDWGPETLTLTNIELR